MKFYISQLKDGKMLVFEDNEVRVEETGYPLPDCRLQIRDKVLNNKADILKEVLYGAITPQVPASILQLHNDVTIVADEAALSKIK